MTNEQTVQAMVENWARAIEQGNRAGILADHSSDLLMFDFPGEVEGIDHYSKTWDFFYQNPRGPIQFTPRDFRVAASDTVAFVTCEIHCDGTSAGPLDFRLTTGFEKVDGNWTITHEHHSVRTIEERFGGSEEQRS